MIGLILAICLNVHAQERTAKIYEIGRTAGEPLFVQKIRVQNKEGKRVQTSTIEDRDGKIQMKETAVMVDGKIVAQNVDNLQINESYELEVRGDEALFRTFKMEDGKRGKMTEEKTRRLPAGYVTGPATERFLKDSAERLTSNETLKTQFGVFEMADFIGMQFKKKGEATETAIPVEMRPSNFFADLFLNPIQLELDPKSFDLKRYVGRTPLRKISGSKSDHFDAEIVYSAWTGLKTDN